MPDCVTVAVAGRLHLGFLDLNGGLGRRFGGLGLALDAPQTRIALSRAATDQAEGPDAPRAMRHLGRLAEDLGLPRGHRLTLHATVPPHAGLGSGTQLALAVAAALRRLHGLPPDIRADALRLERSARSGLGTGFFEAGGLALDGGRGAGGLTAPIVARLRVPEDWRILLVLDPARQGIHGPQERAAFAALPEFPAGLAAHLCRLALMQALPAVAEGDLAAFGRAVTEIQIHVGDHFAAAQGGRYASPAVASVLDRFEALGVEGYGQSSWGPTGFAFAASPAAAARLRDAVAPLAATRRLDLRIVKARNHGAVIAQQASAEQGLLHG